MLIVALVLAVVGLAALVTAVVTSNELIAWVCIAASVIGVLLLIVDAVRDRSKRGAQGEQEAAAEVETEDEFDEEYPEEPSVTEEPDAETTAAVETEQLDHEAADDDRR
jgi:hypothetical protein